MAAAFDAAVIKVFLMMDRKYQTGGFADFVRQEPHLPDFCQRECMGNTDLNVLLLRYLSIPAQGWRRIDDKGANRSGMMC